MKKYVETSVENEIYCVGNLELLEGGKDLRQGRKGLGAIPHWRVFLCAPSSRALICAPCFSRILLCAPYFVLAFLCAASFAWPRLRAHLCAAIFARSPLRANRCAPIFVRLSLRAYLCARPTNFARPSFRTPPQLCALQFAGL